MGLDNFLNEINPKKCIFGNFEKDTYKSSNIKFEETAIEELANLFSNTIYSEIIQKRKRSKDGKK